MTLLIKIAGRLPPSWLKSVGRLQWAHPGFKRAVNWAAERFRNQDAEIQRGEGRGLKFNTGAANAGYLLGTSEPGVQSALAQLIRPKMTVYDIGANVGFFSMIAARLVGPYGRVVSFEPLPMNADQITHNAVINNFDNIVVRLEALGNDNGWAPFFASDVPTLSRLAQFGAPAGSCAQTNVSLRQLDGLIEDTRLPLPDFIKIDVEGAEADVLLGACHTIAKSRPILLVELHGTNGPVAGALEEQGYLVFVLGSRDDVRNAPWNAHIIAVPKEREDLYATSNALAAPALAT